MKKVLILVLSAISFAKVQAQASHSIGAFRTYSYAHPHVSLGFGFYAPYYSPFGYYAFPFSPIYPYTGVYGPTSNLQRKEEDIRMDYQDRIYSVHQDTSLTSKQKRQLIHSLKQERKKEIHALVVNYHKQPAKSSSNASEN